MPTGFEEAIAGAGTIVGGGLAYIQALASNPIYGYFIIVAFAGVDNVIANFSGISLLNIITETVIRLFISDFSWGFYYGVNSLFLIILISPIIAWFFYDLFSLSH